MDVTIPDGRERVAWSILGIVVSLLVLYVLVSFVGGLLVGLFLYYATRPVYRWLDDHLGHPDVSATITLLLVGLPMLLVVGYATFLGLRELDQFLLATDLEGLRATLEPYLGVVAGNGERGALALLRDNIGRIQGFVAAIGVWLLRIFVALALAFYLLRDDRKIAEWYRRSFEDHPSALDFGRAVDRDLTTLYTGNLLTIAATGVIAIVTFLALDFLAPGGAAIAFPILLGLVIGVATLVPAVGMKIVYFPYTAYLLWQTQTPGGPPLWFPAVFFVVTLLVVDSFPDLFVRAYISSGEFNTGLVMLAYVLAAVAFGWYGVFVAPLLLVVALHFARDVFPKLL